MSYCKKCGRTIKFIQLRSGKWNPVDPEKRTIRREEGSEVLITESGELIRGRFACLENGANGVGYVSHFATCQNAGLFRKKGG